MGSTPSHSWGTNTTDQQSVRAADIEGALRTHPLSGECGGVVPEDAETVLAGGDVCYFAATVDLSDAPRRVRVESVDVFVDEPADGDVVGRATLQAVPSDSAKGRTAKLVLSDITDTGW